MTDRFDGIGCPIADIRPRQELAGTGILDAFASDFSELATAHEDVIAQTSVSQLSPEEQNSVIDDIGAAASSIIGDFNTFTQLDIGEQESIALEAFGAISTILEENIGSTTTEPTVSAAGLDSLISEFGDIAEGISTIIDEVRSISDPPSSATSTSSMFGIFWTLAIAGIDFIIAVPTVTVDSSSFTSADDDDTGDNMNIGAIVGGTVGGIAFIGSLLLLLIFLRRRRKGATITAASTSGNKFTDDPAQSCITEEKIVGCPDDPDISQLQRKPVQSSLAEPIPVEAPNSSHIAQLDSDPMSSPGHDPISPLDRPLPAQLESEHGTSQLHGDSAGASTVRELPRKPVGKASVTQLHSDPADRSNLRHEITAGSKLVDHSSVIRR